MKLTRRIIIIVFVGIYNGLYAQDSTRNVIIDVKVSYGSVLPHYSFMNYLITEAQKSFEIQTRTHTNTKHLSSYLYRFPTYGVGYNYTSLGNPNKLGGASILFGVLDIPIIETPLFSWFYQCNLGFAYLHKPLEKSIHNIAMSSFFNFFIGFDMYAQYQISTNHVIRTGIDISHLSNGKIKTPNLGFNSVALSLSYIHNFGMPCENRVCYNSRTLPSHSTFSYIVSGGLKSDEYLSPERFLTSSSVIEYQKIFRYKYGLCLGADVFYDSSKPHTAKFTHMLNGGIHTGVEVYFIPWGFTMQTGLYVIQKPSEYTQFYRVAIRYYGLQSYILQFGLKTHNTTADFLEIGVGYRFPNIRTYAARIQQ